VQLRAAEGAGYAVSRKVGAADIPGLTRPDHVFHGGEGLIKRRVPVGEVHLVQVDVVGAEPPQRRVDGVEDVLAGQAAVPWPVAGDAVALGGDHVALALAAQPAADDLLRSAVIFESAA
jgi:hypothetical protein